MRRLPTALIASSIAGGLLLTACGGGGEVAAPASTDPVVVAGYNTAVERNCTSCHSADGTSSSGPTWKGLAGRTVTLADGATVPADDAYLRTAIVEPDAQIPEGYKKGIMSSYTKGQEPLTDQQVAELIAYIKTLK